MCAKMLINCKNAKFGVKKKKTGALKDAFLGTQQGRYPP
jgi:hypothetical protein